MPAIVEIFIQNLTKIIEFDFLNIETIIKLFKPEFSLEKVLGIDTSTIENMNIVKRLRFIIILSSQVVLLTLAANIL